MPIKKSPASQQDGDNKTKINDKSTKAKIWEAYNELLEKVEGKPIEVKLEQKETAVNNILKNLAELKLDVGQNLDKIGNELLSDLNDLQDTRNKLSKEKMQMLENLRLQKELLENEVKKVKNQWEETKKTEELKLAEEIRAKKLERDHEEDEYKYNLQIERKQEKDKYIEVKIAREKTLHDREMNIKNREDEIAKMEVEISEMPKKLENIIKETKENISKELNQKHSIELNELKLNRQNEAKLSQMKITNLENEVKSQNTEIENLRRELSAANKQLKEIAVSAIESRKPIQNNNEKEK